MAKWELVMITNVNGTVRLLPAGKLNIQSIVEKLPKVKSSLQKDFDADQLDFGSDWAAASRVYHSVLQWLGSEGWEPFAVDHGLVYLRRQL